MIWIQYLINELRFLELTPKELEFHINKYNKQMKVLDEVRMKILDCQDVSSTINHELLNEYEKLNDKKQHFIKRLKELNEGV